MMRLWWLVVAAFFLIAGTSPARADALKEAIYVLGVHIGNANGVLYGLNNSYDRSVRAHPAAVPLLRRQITFTSDLAAALGLETADLARLDAELAAGRLTFGEMAVRFDAITERLQTDVSRMYRNNSGSVFKLGAVVAKTGGVAKLVASLLPEGRESRRPAVVTWANYTQETLLVGRMDTSEGLSIGPAQELIRKASSGPLADAISAADVAVSTWQSDFGSAPAWKAGPEAPFLPQVKSPPPVKPVPASAFAQRPPKGRVAASRTALSSPGSAPAAAGKGSSPGSGRTAVARSRPAVASPSVKTTPAPKKVDWTGPWTAQAGLVSEVITLQQSGSSVTGTRAKYGGQLQGTLSSDGRTLKGHWSNESAGSDTYFVFTLSTDGRSFSGSWWYDEEMKRPGGTWSGVRK